MTEDLKIIKKIYGEAMMHFCRTFFSSILEKQGLLVKLLQDNFAPSHELYEDLDNNKMLSNFKNYIYYLFSKKDENLEVIDLPTPEALIRRAGYILYECKTEEEIQAFKKYYANGEELCTFQGGRLDSCYVFFAIKENVDEINRADFKNPKRQDEYGTSVISIQFSKDFAHTLSIKNRYNHTVNNPDATFSNNLDNIIKGLTKSFEKYYGLKQEHKNDEFEITGYVRANDGKWYKYNLEINNVYYCPNNIIIDNGEVKKYPKEKYIIMDYFILDLTQKEICLYDNSISESLPSLIGKIKKITVEKNKEEKEITIITEKNEEMIIIIDKHNQIIGFKSKDIKMLGNNFLCNNRVLAYIDIPNLQQVGNKFLYNNLALKSLSLPSLQQASYDFLFSNKALENLDLPELQIVLGYFLYKNISLTTLNLPKLQQVGNNFLPKNQLLMNLNLPMLQRVGRGFLSYNTSLTSINLPELQEVGDGFLYSNKIITKVELPKLKEAKNTFLTSNEALVKLELPSLQKVEAGFLYNNKSLADVRLPMLQEVGDNFLFSNAALVTFELPAIQKVADNFMASNCKLKCFKAPMLQEIGCNFLYNNRSLSKLEFPTLHFVESDFLHWNEKLTFLDLPKLEKAGDNFLANSKSLAILKVPALQRAGNYFLCLNKTLYVIECPLLQAIGEAFLELNSLMREKIQRQIEENQRMKR